MKKRKVSATNGIILISHFKGNIFSLPEGPHTKTGLWKSGSYYKTSSLLK
jgi:hypothetical protein